MNDACIDDEMSNYSMTYSYTSTKLANSWDYRRHCRAAAVRKQGRLSCGVKQGLVMKL